MTTKEIYNLKQASIASMIIELQNTLKGHAEEVHENGPTRGDICDIIEVEKDLTNLLNKIAGE